MPLLPPKWNTFIIPVIITEFIDKCLEKIYKYNESGTFYVYIIDQTIKGLDSTKLRNQYRNLMVIRTPKSDMHYTGNLGFAQATNLGASLVQTPYFTMINDDVELIHKDWWQATLDTFTHVEKSTPDTPAILVVPGSIRLADWSLGRDEGDNFDIIPYKKDYTDEDWRHLVEDSHPINDRLTLQPNTVIDGVTMYCTVVDTKKFNEVGRLDEKYKFGGGEDYDFGCMARMHGYRSVSTTKSWVFHHWSSSFKAVRDKNDVKGLLIPELNWNQNHGKWGERFNIWGIQCRECKKEGIDNPLQVIKDNGTIAVCPKHPLETYKMPESTTYPL